MRRCFGINSLTDSLGGGSVGEQIEQGSVRPHWRDDPATILATISEFDHKVCDDGVLILKGFNVNIVLGTNCPINSCQLFGEMSERC